VRKELGLWRAQAKEIPDLELRRQALASLSAKQFHADGGSVYAAYSLPTAPRLVRLIVALQTISDYLDNLCDRCATFDEGDFHQLHHAMRDAVTPDAPLRPYYAVRGNPDDGGYLNLLVSACQDELRNFPGYAVAYPHVRWFVERYCELQEYKHIQPSQRTQRLMDWAQPYIEQYPQLSWWEFAAATGSTLGMFALFTASMEPLSESRASALRNHYFPWICGLHILLDYLIDLEEDKEEDDFNFIRCYDSMDEAHQRLRYIKGQALQSSTELPRETVHSQVVKGLLAMYLSDEKTDKQAWVRPALSMVWTSGPTTWAFYGACRLYRVIR